MVVRSVASKFKIPHRVWSGVVGCAHQIREYEQQREQADKEASEAALAKRQKAKDDAAEAAAALKA
eukprot:2499573-Prymnesium_polylepis.1